VEAVRYSSPVDVLTTLADGSLCSDSLDGNRKSQME